VIYRNVPAIEYACPAGDALVQRKKPQIERQLVELAEARTGGSSTQAQQKWVRCSLRQVKKRLGVAVGTAKRLLKKLDYALRGNRKRLSGNAHPKRDQQFRYLARIKRLFHRAALPVISVDAKKKELIGRFANRGRRWCRSADEVNCHDFPKDATARVTPYGIYDACRQQGHVCVGLSADTAEFAVQSIRTWWYHHGQRAYPGKKHLLIEADGGGSNGSRLRLWKRELQRWADEDQLTLWVCHYPPGASKWNPIEHRLFSQISNNWEGEPLTSIDKVLGLIRGTTTDTGLTVTASLDTQSYERRLKVSDQEMRTLNLHRRKICPQWNYVIKPRE
jgi:hypothetical protein